MGLLDSILGNLTGAGGEEPRSSSGASSPLVKALMMLLTAKAYQNYRSRSHGGSGSMGGLGGMLGGQGGGLGGMLGGQGGGMGGGMLSGGLGGLLGGLLGGGALGSGGGLGGLLDQSARTATAIMSTPGSAQARTAGSPPTSSRKRSDPTPSMNWSSRPECLGRSCCRSSHRNCRMPWTSSPRTGAFQPRRKLRPAGSDDRV